MTTTHPSAARTLLGASAIALAVGSVFAVLGVIGDQVLRSVFDSVDGSTESTTQALINRLTHDYGFGAAPSLWQLLAMVVLALVLTGACIGALAYWLRLDPQQRAAASVRWAWRALRAEPYATSALALLALGIGALAEESLKFTVILVVYAVLMIPLSLGIYRRDTASSVDGHGWWRARWPGWTSLLAALRLVVLLWMLEHAVERLRPGNLGLPGLPIDAAFWLLNVLVPLLAGAAILWRVGLQTLWQHRRALVARDVLGPWLVQSLLMLALLAIPGALLVLGVAFDVFVVPQLQFNAGGSTPPMMLLVRFVTGPLALSGLVLGVLVDHLSRSRLIYLLLAPALAVDASAASPSSLNTVALDAP